MAVTQTTRFALKKHDPGDIEWADDMNANMDDIDDALGLLLADGSDPTPGLLSQKVDGATLSVDTAAHKLAVVPDATLRKLYAVDSGSANAMATTPTPAWSAYAAGQSLWIKAAANNTGTATLNISGLGAKTVKKPDGNALTGGEVKAGGIYLFTYDGTDFQLLGGTTATATDDKKVKASSSDPTPGFLDAKVDGTTIQVVNNLLTVPGGGGGGGGDYTINDTQVPTSDTGPLASVLSWLGNMIKSITGKTSWRTAPATTLEAAAAHQGATNNPHAVTKAQVGLGNVPNTKHNTAATTDPAVTDDSGAGYAVGSVWVNATADTVFLCVDAAAGAAIWRKLIYQGQAWTQQIDGGEFWLFNDGNNVRFLFGDNATSGQYGVFEWDSANDYMKFGTDANGLKIKGNNIAIGNIFPGAPLIVGSGSTEILRISATLNMGLRTSDFGSGQGVLAIADAQSVPSVNPIGGGVLYVEGGALKYRGSGGTVTTLGAA